MSSSRRGFDYTKFVILADEYQLRMSGITSEELGVIISDINAQHEFEQAEVWGRA